MRQADLAASRELVRDAFADNEPAETVAFLDALRTEGCVLGEWVAEDETGLVAHIVFSRIWVEGPSRDRSAAAMLTPLAVRSDRQRQGSGTRIMRHALAELERRGESVFFVLGHPAFYPRAGFDAGLAARVESPWTGNPAFMARGNVPPGRLVLPRSIAEAH